MRRVLRELARYILRQKKYWLAPIILVLVVVLALIVVSAKAGILAPFIYPLF